MEFIGEVVAWYHHNKRDLPWRKTKDPYIIWLSEVILQQTRVEQGMPYFHAFAEAYPTVADFALADEQEILRKWQGLGYYSRGRNMLKTAQIVMEEHGGYFPKKFDELIKLKGIGDYTAAAISSFAADEPKAVVDGNVYRLLSRYFGIDDPINSAIGKKKFALLADAHIDKSNPGISNQAMMEFGSLQCRPKNPNCGTCPLAVNCFARWNNMISELPVKIKNSKLKNRYFNYFLVMKDGQVLLEKRIGNDIWENLFQLPLLETEMAISNPLIGQESFFRKFGSEDLEVIEVLSSHQRLSHQKINARFFLLSGRINEFFGEKNWKYFSLDEAEALPKPKIIFHFFKKFPILKANQL